MPEPEASAAGGPTPRLEDDRLVAADGARLPLAVWRPASGRPWAAAVALHGFNDYRMAFSEVGSELAERGVAVYAYDQRGFGQAPGRGYWHGSEAMIADYRTAVALVRARHPGLPVFAIGESMGGAVVLAAHAEAPRPEVDGVVLIAPAVWGASTMPVWQTAPLWLFAHTIPWWPMSGAGLPITPSDNVAMLRRLSVDPLIIRETRADAVYGLVRLMDEGLAGAAALAGPALVLYGGADDIVPKAPTCRMIRSLPAPPAGAWRIVLYPEGHHMLTRDLAGREPIDDIAAFLASLGGPLPSGAEIDRAQAARAPALRAEKLCARFPPAKDP
ncbi:MAG: alpha/beta fold hydrolase [Alphaproteobacteria bacterium]|nr:alpha/beta fold hydrolase [Alphaproteobacteria bacterium]